MYIARLKENYNENHLQFFIGENILPLQSFGLAKHKIHSDAQIRKIYTFKLLEIIYNSRDEETSPPLQSSRLAKHKTHSDAQIRKSPHSNHWESPTILHIKHIVVL